MTVAGMTDAPCDPLSRPDRASPLPHPDAVPGEPDVDDLATHIVGLAGRIAAATCRWLLLVAEFDARDGCARFGLASTARWLTHACGITHRTSVEHVRVARALAGFPTLVAALESGWISYSRARAISRLAGEGEHGVVDDLVAVAEHGTVGQLETVVRGLRTVGDNAADTPDREYVRHGRAARTSHWRMSVRLNPERGAVIEHAVAQLAEAEGVTRADALVRPAEIGLAALTYSDDGPPPGPRGHERAAVLIHLNGGAVREPDEQREPRSAERGSHPGGVERPYARIANGPGLPRRVVERLLCACRIRVAVFDGADVLDVGRSRRVVDDRTFRALLFRDGHCTYPGCAAQHKLEAHHVIHRLHGGRTDMANLVLLCPRHHHAHHDGDFGIIRVGSRRRGYFEFRRADGRLLQRHLHPAHRTGAALPPIETEFPHIPDTAICSKTLGDRLDRAWAVAVLAERRTTRAVRVAAEHSGDPWDHAA